MSLWAGISHGQPVPCRYESNTITAVPVREKSNWEGLRSPGGGKQCCSAAENSAPELKR